MIISVKSVVSFARLFFRSPTESTELDAVGDGEDFFTDVMALPSFKRFENDIEAIAKLKGWGTTRDPETGHISAIIPPDYDPQNYNGAHGKLMAPGT